MKGDSVFSPSEPARGRAVGNPSGFVAGGHLSSLDKRASLASLSPTKLLRKKTSAEPPADEDLSDWEDLVPGNLVIDLDGSGNSPTTTAVANGDCQSAERKRKLAKMPDRPSGSVEESPSGRTDKVNGAKRDKSGSKLNWKPKENHSDLTSEPLPKMKIKRNKMPTRQSGAKHEVISVVEESSSNALSGGTQDSTLSTDTSNSTLEMPKIQEGMVESCSTASSASTSTITTTSQPSSSSAGETLIENGHKDESPLVGKSHKSKMGKGRRDNTTIDAIEEPLQKRPKLSPSQKPETSDAVTWVRTTGTDVEPELLGTCEPGTPVTLEGIVWNETAAGVLVVNVTWRGKTYVGTLLDCTKYDWAPPRLSDVNVAAATDKTPKGRGGKKGNCRGNGNNRGKNGGGRTSGTNSPDKLGNSKEDSEDSGSLHSSNGDSTKPTPMNESCLTECQSQYECPSSGCSKKFSHLSALKYHQNSAHRILSPKTEKSPVFLLQNGSASTSVPPATAPTVAPTNDSPSECDTPSAAGSNTSESRSSPTSTEPATSAITATKNAEDTMVKGTGEETSVSPGPIISLSETSNFPGNSAPSLEFLANVATSLQSMEKDFSIAQLEQKLAVVTAAISTGNEDEKISTESNQFDSAAAAAAAAAASGNLSAEEAESLEKLFEVVTVCKTTGESLPASNVSPQVSTGVDLPTLEPTGTSEGPIEGERDGALSPAYSDISDANEDESAPFLEKQTQGDKLLNNSAAAILLTTPAQVDAVPTESFAGMFLSPTSCPTTISSGTSQTDQITTALLVKSPAPANGDVINSAELTSSDIIAAKELDSGRKHPQDQLQLNHKSHKRLKESHSSGHKESEKTTGTTGAEKKVSGEMPTERPKSMTPGIKTPHNNNLASKENLQTHHSSRPKSSALTTTITTTANSSSSPAVVKTECRSPCATPLAGDQCRAGGNGMMRGFSPCPPLPYHPNMPFSGFSGMPSFGLPGGLPFDPSHPMFQAAFNPAMVGFGGPPGFVGNPMMFGPHGALPHDLRPPAKALDMLQRQASQYYGGQNSTAASLVSAAHKIHELAEHAKTTGTENTSGDPTSGKLQSSNGAESAPLPKDRVKGALLSNSDKQVGAEGTKSPPVQRHLHTHHHTHTVLGAQLDPYAAMLASQQAAAAAAVGVHFASK